MVWEVVDRPGYMGDARDRLYSEWDQEYGKGNWRIAYEWGTLILPRELGLQIYEDAYTGFFEDNPAQLEWLVRNFSDVWDTAESNIDSGFDYSIQETPNNHIHDIAIRRAVMRTGRWFEGDRLLHVRWKESEGFRLNPGVVRFHKPELIFAEVIENRSGKRIWWERESIEDFYQKNKVLQVKRYAS